MNDSPVYGYAVVARLVDHALLRGPQPLISPVCSCSCGSVRISLAPAAARVCPAAGSKPLPALLAAPAEPVSAPFPRPAPAPECTADQTVPLVAAMVLPAEQEFQMLSHASLLVAVTRAVLHLSVSAAAAILGICLPACSSGWCCCTSVWCSSTSGCFRYHAWGATLAGGAPPLSD